MTGSVPFFGLLSTKLESVPASTLPPRHRLVLLILAAFAKPDGRCFPGLDRLSARSGYGRTTLCKTLAELVAAGWLERRKRAPVSLGAWQGKVYRVRLDGRPVNVKKRQTKIGPVA